MRGGRGDREGGGTVTGILTKAVQVAGFAFLIAGTVALYRIGEHYRTRDSGYNAAMNYCMLNTPGTIQTSVAEVRCYIQLHGGQ